MPFVSVPVMPVLLGAVMNMVIGAFWYSPLLFRKQWIQLMGFQKKDLEKAKKEGMGKTYAIQFGASLVMSYMIGYFLSALEITSVEIALKITFFAWVGLIAPVTLGSILWEGKSLKLYILNNAYTLLTMCVMSVILVSWR